MMADIPTLTAVRLSSSEALLSPPALLDILILLALLGCALAMALIGLWIPPGEAGGELAMTAVWELRTKCAVSQVS